VRLPPVADKAGSPRGRRTAVHEHSDIVAREAVLAKPLATVSRTKILIPAEPPEVSPTTPKCPRVQVADHRLCRSPTLWVYDDGSFNRAGAGIVIGRILHDQPGSGDIRETDAMTKPVKS
jgi:hypothetical protein